MSTIFTRIINREADGTFVYEDEWMIAILDINPINPGHLLIIPREEKASYRDLSPEVAARMMVVAQKLGDALINSMNADGLNLFMTDGDVSGQEVPHAHLHLMPRFESDDNFEVLYGEKEQSRDEVIAMAEQLSERLSKNMEGENDGNC